ncbi:hypothetical protein IMG5_091120, partial [Ichthyophthirius multifiliis]
RIKVIEINTHHKNPYSQFILSLFKKILKYLSFINRLNPQIVQQRVKTAKKQKMIFKKRFLLQQQFINSLLSQFFKSIFSSSVKQYQNYQYYYSFSSSVLYSPNFSQIYYFLIYDINYKEIKKLYKNLQKKKQDHQIFQSYNQLSLHLLIQIIKETKAIIKSIIEYKYI